MLWIFLTLLLYILLLHIFQLFSWSFYPLLFFHIVFFVKNIRIMIRIFFPNPQLFLNYTSNKRISMFIDKISKFAIFLNYNINIINLGLDHLNNSFLSVIDSILNTQFFIIIDQYIKNIYMIYMMFLLWFLLNIIDQMRSEYRHNDLIMVYKGSFIEEWWSNFVAS